MASLPSETASAPRKAGKPKGRFGAVRVPGQPAAKRLRKMDDDGFAYPVSHSSTFRRLGIARSDVDDPARARFIMTVLRGYQTTG